MNFQTLQTTVENKVAYITLNRPEKANAINATMWQEIRDAFNWASETTAVRAVIFNGSGAHFSAGIDLEMLMSIQKSIQSDCEGRTREKLLQLILDLQDTVTAIQRCRKPVLAAIHGQCIGGGVDLIAACDMRYCTKDASFSIKEIDMGMTADLGSLQRLPKIMGAGILSELAYTGRKVFADEAQQIGLVNRYYETAADMVTAVKKIAETITQKSPLAIRGVKAMLNYSYDHSIAESLNTTANWNAAMLLSNDLTESLTAFQQKRTPQFED